MLIPACVEFQKNEGKNPFRLKLLSILKETESHPDSVQVLILMLINSLIEEKNLDRMLVEETGLVTWSFLRGRLILGHLTNSDSDIRLATEVEQDSSQSPIRRCKTESDINSEGMIKTRTVKKIASPLILIIRMSMYF